jgi:hypothetical protein
MANTTNFNWETPDDTDLVKDGAAAIRTLGNSIDTSLVDLKGGTTGQVLAKASNTDLDFTWASDASGIPATIFDAKGDLIAASAADTAARLAVGTNGQFLSANSSTSTGLEWVAAPTSGANWSLLNSGGTSLSGAQTVTISGISGKDRIMVLVNSAVIATSTQEQIGVRLNTDTGANYIQYGTYIDAPTTYSCDFIYRMAGVNGDNFIYIAKTSANANSSVSGYVTFSGCNSSGVKEFHSAGGVSRAGACSHQAYITGGYYAGTSTISSVSIYNKSANFTGGTVYVYASA